LQEYLDIVDDHYTGEEIHVIDDIFVEQINTFVYEGILKDRKVYKFMGSIQDQQDG
jgi:hypothetical protein